MTRAIQTHESFIAAIVAIAVARPNLSAEQVSAIAEIKIVYGSGPNGTRGVTYFRRWSNGDDKAEPVPLVEICAGGESSPIQLSGTTLHELAHVIAGPTAGHGADWRKACGELGLSRAVAAGQSYDKGDFDSVTRSAHARLKLPADGAPLASIGGADIPGGIVPRPCGAGIGSRGGKSHGVGSGSRQLKAYCGECDYVIRTSARWLDTGTPICPCGAGSMIDARDDK